MSAATFEIHAFQMQRSVSANGGDNGLRLLDGKRNRGRHRMRPVQAHEPVCKRLCGTAHFQIDAHAINAHELASHVAPGDQESASRTVDTPIPPT
jgi:hypothetical protein